ncbi:MAG: Hpt domain-containing protein [Limnohabitans sp.]
MSKSADPIYLSIERAMEFIGDANGVLSLLKTLQQTLSADLPLLVELLNQGDVQGAHQVLHQLKGFTPVFCVDRLVERVVAIEQLSKHGEAAEVRAAYAQLAPQLAQLHAEVVKHLASHPVA